MNPYVKTVIQNRVAKLMADNEVLVRQIPFLVQRAEDMKAVLKENVAELQWLRAELSAASSSATSVAGQSSSTPASASPSTLPSQETDGCKYHSSPEPGSTTHLTDNDLPKHTSIIVG